ncbi:unnamed protein product [Mytilus edulis]|uniref:Uncharacterized protein n=1 Tax=Mytilus edulis TaxID=6550 RepID=A0A8S3U9H3_MYTED|nr:unnamed protein product [Mytilus edulis]
MQPGISKELFFKVIKSKLRILDEQLWFTKLWNDNSNVNGNKLRLYRRYKKDLQPEHYVTNAMPRHLRRTEETNDSSTFEKNEQTDKCKTTNGASTATGTEFDDGLARFYSRPRARNERFNPMYDTYFSSDTADNDSEDDVVSNSNNETDDELQTGNAEMDVEGISISYGRKPSKGPKTKHHSQW